MIVESGATPFSTRSEYNLNELSDKVREKPRLFGLVIKIIFKKLQDSCPELKLGDIGSNDRIHYCEFDYLNLKGVFSINKIAFINKITFSPLKINNLWCPRLTQKVSNSNPTTIDDLSNILKKLHKDRSKMIDDFLEQNKDINEKNISDNI